MIPGASAPRLLTTNAGIQIFVVPVPLRRGDDNTPWCYAASISPCLGDADADHEVISPSLPDGSNFLASQVWPSARAASAVVEKHLCRSWTVCELGCGPGLPSLTAARCGAKQVVATDVDTFALELVEASAREQGFLDEGGGSGARFRTFQFDMLSKTQLPSADLYLISDVFESSSVAEGAAFHIQNALSVNNSKLNGIKSRFWVFAQQDRAQRETFLRLMQDYYDSVAETERKNLEWSSNHSPDKDEELWLFDLDEIHVRYN
ncbi:hypothetical protein THAOC_28491 [Thalassiosira oceanica]|uniref:Methyltransferase domain-containing protein n=1 Tax=Thalassiosira oceanica TaxID=159749 RepID=K0RGA1_THAOC|nr:hypothetical protein THAOC_28491 [Thalassiosira oceanica]|mmetsp:Transcript_25801/g.61285  ORF Transcript_25801/g.61285 Transcript_25801/m.61285 type:complete len:263 (+) Transcript_25801:183-971(+)|eukprot:EJK52260.1 hypothetical protein THAOC_28491 [Thalassiosira oceanica]